MIEPLYFLIGARISARRNRRGLTQEMLAASLRPPMTRASICNIENGIQRVMVHQLVDIADALGITPAGLLRGAITSGEPDLPRSPKKRRNHS